VQRRGGSFGEKFALEDFPQKLLHGAESFCNFTVTRGRGRNVLRLKRPGVLELTFGQRSTNFRHETLRPFPNGAAIKQPTVVAVEETAR